MDFSFDSIHSTGSTNPTFLEYTEPETSKNGASTSTNDFDLSTFTTDGFSDFQLDLSCLSNPPSPASSSTPLADTENPAPVLTRIPTPTPPSPFSVSSHSPKRDSESSLRRLSIEKPASLIRNTLPLPVRHYVGRGTPIDRNRRVEWGGDVEGKGEGDDVGEDGMLLSRLGEHGRAHSMDSHNYHYRHRRSTSSEWQTVPTPRTLSPLLHMNLDSSSMDQHQTGVELEPLPESSKIHIEVDSSPNDWDSVMQTVLGSAGSSTSTSSTAVDQQGQMPVAPAPQATLSRSHTIRHELDAQGPFPGVPLHPNGLDIVLGLNNALDLGLSVEREMNFFDLGLIPDSGRDTPSVYSSAAEEVDTSTPHPSRPSSQVHTAPEHEDDGGGRFGMGGVREEEEGSEEEDNESDRTTTADAYVDASANPVIPFNSPKLGARARARWWDNAWRRVRKFPMSRLFRSYRKM